MVEMENSTEANNKKKFKKKEDLNIFIILSQK
jgi:hypothetical protein